jgi:hypothetical protein
LVPPDVLTELRDRVAEDPRTPRWMAWLEKPHVDEIAELEHVLASGDAKAMEHALSKCPLYACARRGRRTRPAREDR